MDTIDVQTLMRDGIAAFRDDRDPLRARQLLTRAVKLDKSNEMAWLWLSRTYDNEPDMKLKCLERALMINPSNEKVQALKARLESDLYGANVNGNAAGADSAVTTSEVLAAGGASFAPAFEPEHPPTAKQPVKLSTREKQQVRALLAKAKQYEAKGKTEGAVDEWLRVLEIQPDNLEAMQPTIRYLASINEWDIAHDLIWDAINSGTQIPAIYLTALDIARQQQSHSEADYLREQLAALPGTNEDLIAKVADDFTKSMQFARAEDLLEKAIANNPDSQKLLRRLADIYDEEGRNEEAMRLYDRAARLGAGTKEGRAADKRLGNYIPVLTDRERGSLGLALREAVGFGAVFLLMGWHDAGLDLLQMGGARWLGVGISIIGGYLLITATSSPQQRPIAGLLGGSVPENEEVEPQTNPGELDPLKSGAVEDPTDLPQIPIVIRVALGVVGVILLISATGMVFDRALDLLANPTDPQVLTFDEFCTEYGCYDDYGY